MKKELYRWQEECLKRWMAAGGRGMVQAATGSGKTFLALTAAQRLEKEPGGRLKVKIVVPTGALMRQWVREFLSDAGGGSPLGFQPDIGLRGGGEKSNPAHKYMIYVINSARYELARQILAELKEGGRILLIADECHRYESGQNRLIFEFMPYIEPYADRRCPVGKPDVSSHRFSAPGFTAMGLQRPPLCTRSANTIFIISGCPLGGKRGTSTRS